MVTVSAAVTAAPAKIKSSLRVEGGFTIMMSVVAAPVSVKVVAPLVVAPNEAGYVKPNQTTPLPNNTKNKTN
jgi:hypothetical protein